MYAAGNDNNMRSNVHLRFLNNFDLSIFFQ